MALFAAWVPVALGRVAEGVTHRSWDALVQELEAGELVIRAQKAAAQHALWAPGRVLSGRLSVLYVPRANIPTSVRRSQTRPAPIVPPILTHRRAAAR